jgi:hypothetical protein
VFGVVPLRRVHIAAADRIDDLESLQLLFLPLLRSLRRHLDSKLVGEPLESLPVTIALRDRTVVRVQISEQRADTLGADLDAEISVAFLPGLLRELPVRVLVQDLLVLDFLFAGIRDHVRRVVDHALEVTELHSKQIAHLRRQRLEEPDMRNGNRQLDVAHPLTTDLRQRDFDSALVADMSPVPNSLELPAVALPVLDWTENALAEQSIPFRLERPIVDRLGLRDLSVTPGPDLVG